MVKLVLEVHSIVDIMTNSSSELFVTSAKNKETIKEMIKSVYPNYLDEYEEVKELSELSLSELSCFLDYRFYRDIPNELMKFKGKWGIDVTEDNKSEIIDFLSNEVQMFFMFSIYDNPNWEMQEALEYSANMTRYHLG